MQTFRIAVRGLALALPVAAAAGEVAPHAASQWGRASDDNLRAMARPGDLVAPAAGGAGNGRLDAAAVARLMDGKVIDLKREGSTVGGSSTAPQ